MVLAESVDVNLGVFRSWDADSELPVLSSEDGIPKLFFA
jgi:hypothetical protein